MSKTPYGPVRATRRRQAFTLVEMLVSMALVLFIMLILSEAFTAGLEAFRQLKAIGDMNDRLRDATKILRGDLQSVRFNGGHDKLSVLGASVPLPPSDGFFRVWQGRAPANGTASGPISPGPASFSVTPTTDTNNTPPQWTVAVGSTLIVDSGPNQETIKITGAGSGGSPFQATFNNSHPATFSVVPCEGMDPDGYPSVLSTNHSLHFAINLFAKGNRQEDFLSAKVADAANPSVLGQSGPVAYQDQTNHFYYNSPWAEVVYFLQPTNVMTTGDAANPPRALYALYRRQFLALPYNPPYSSINNNGPSSATPAPATTSAPPPEAYSSAKQGQYYYEVSCKADPRAGNSPWLPPGSPYNSYFYFNGLSDLTIPERRFGMNPNPGSAGFGTLPPTDNWPYARIGDPPLSEPTAYVGGDIILTDVLSFDIQVYAPSINGNDFIYLPVVSASQNPTYAGKRIFDTWAGPLSPSPYSSYATFATPGTAQSIPQNTNIQAVRITLRIWDSKTRRARQVTVFQDM